MRVKLTTISAYRGYAWFIAHRGKQFEVFQKDKNGYYVDMTACGRLGEMGFFHTQEVEEIFEKKDAQAIQKALEGFLPTHFREIACRMEMDGEVFSHSDLQSEQAGKLIELTRKRGYGFKQLIEVICHVCPVLILETRPE